MLQGAADHIAFASISQLAGASSSGIQNCAPDLDPHFASDVINFARLITQQEKRDDLEHPLLVSP